MNGVLLLWLASLVSLGTTAVHIVGGGAQVARPLLANDSLPEASKWLSYCCWHITTALLLVMSAGYAWAALQPTAMSVAILLTALALISSVLSVWVALKAGVNPLRLPPTTLFALIFGLGVFAIMSNPHGGS